MLPTRKLLNQLFLVVMLSHHYGRHLTLFNLYRYVPFVVITSRFFPHSGLITRFVTRVARRVPYVEMELHTRPEHLTRLPCFTYISGVLSNLLKYIFDSVLWCAPRFSCSNNIRILLECGLSWVRAPVRSNQRLKLICVASPLSTQD